MSPAPLVLTATLDEQTQAHFDRLRRTHFPPERNHLAAHLTLFHALPGDYETAVTADVEAAAGRPPIEATVVGVRSLGRGVAFALACPVLTALRRDLATRWSSWLTPQDRGKRDLHVTVQNKVHPDTARALHAELSQGFAPWPATATGLALWRYVGGPWDAVHTFPFSSD